MAESEKIPHALLFCGQSELGKKTVALEFLKKILGKDIFLHPDFFFVEPIEKEIQISQIRELNRKLSLKSFSSPFKVAIIDRAHLMNKETQNCFLKTLEEPKGKTILILVSEYPEMLLPTILSRIQRIKFHPVERKEIENYLKSQRKTPEEISMISEISMGKPGMAISFSQDPRKLADFKKRIKEISSLLDSDLAQRFQYAKKISEDENLKEILDIWLNFFRNILLSSLSLQKKWVILKKDYSLEKIKNILKNVQSTSFLLSNTNVNQKLALELLLMEL